jgi:hypothetical protein
MKFHPKSSAIKAMAFTNRYPTALTDVKELQLLPRRLFAKSSLADPQSELMLQMNPVHDIAGTPASGFATQLVPYAVRESLQQIAR